MCCWRIVVSALHRQWSAAAGVIYDPPHFLNGLKKTMMLMFIKHQNRSMKEIIPEFGIVQKINLAILYSAFSFNRIPSLSKISLSFSNFAMALLTSSSSMDSESASINS